MRSKWLPWIRRHPLPTPNAYRPIPKTTRNTGAKAKSDLDSKPQPTTASNDTAPIRGRYGTPYASMTYAAAFLLGGHVFVTYFYSFDFCSGVSMLPTLAMAGDCVCISKYYRRGRGVQLGDLVSFTSPVWEGESALKRVVGLPGDFVLMNTPGKSDTMIQVPEGHCWVTGDNLLHSRDSRAWGPLPLALINGKALFKFDFHRFIPSGFSMLQRGLRPAALDNDLD